MGYAVINPINKCHRPHTSMLDGAGWRFRKSLCKFCYSYEHHRIPSTTQSQIWGHIIINTIQDENHNVEASLSYIVTIREKMCKVFCGTPLTGMLDHNILLQVSKSSFKVSTFMCKDWALYFLVSKWPWE